MWSFGRAARRRPRWVCGRCARRIALVYIFGGIAKLDTTGSSTRSRSTSARRDTDFPVMAARSISRGRVRVQLCGPALRSVDRALLLWRRTRPLAYVAVIAFHLVTARMFTSACSVDHDGQLALFLPPDWPRRFMRDKQPGTSSCPGGRARSSACSACTSRSHVLVPLRGIVSPAMRSGRGGLPLHGSDGDGEDGSLSCGARAGHGRRWKFADAVLTRYQAKMAASHPDCSCSSRTSSPTTSRARHP